MSNFLKGPDRKQPKTPIAKRIERRRKKLELSRADLARACGAKGRYIDSWIRRLVNSEILAKDIVPLAKVLKAPVSWLLTGKKGRIRVGS